METIRYNRKALHQLISEGAVTEVSLNVPLHVGVVVIRTPVSQFLDDLPTDAEFDAIHRGDCLFILPRRNGLPALR